jgi:hypothetical protein
MGTRMGIFPRCRTRSAIVRDDSGSIGVGMNWEIQLARPLRTHRCGLPEIVRTLGDAIDLIDEDLPETLRFQPAWRELKEMLVTAAETRTSRAVENATTLLETCSGR